MNDIQKKHIQNNHCNIFFSDDPELYITIINFYNSIVIGIIASYMIHEQFENEGGSGRVQQVLRSWNCLQRKYRR